MAPGYFLPFAEIKFTGYPIYKPTNSRRIKNKRRKAHIARTSKNQNTTKHGQLHRW